VVRVVSGTVLDARVLGRDDYVRVQTAGRFAEAIPCVDRAERAPGARVDWGVSAFIPVPRTVPGMPNLLGFRSAVSFCLWPSSVTRAGFSSPVQKRQS
jgi:hypothetical protein